MSFPTSFLGLVASLIYQRIQLRIQGLKVVVRKEEQIPPQELQRIDMMWSAVSGLSFQEPVAVASMHTQGLRAALAAGEPKRLVRAIALEAILSATPGPKTALESNICSTWQALCRKQLGLRYDWNGQTGIRLYCISSSSHATLSPLTEAESLFASRVPKAWWELTTVRSLLTWAYMHIGDLQ